MQLVGERRRQWARGSSRTPSTLATALGTSVASASAASSTSQTPSRNASTRLAATAWPSRVLPTPPGAVRVSSRAAPRSRRASAISRSRPTKLVSWWGRLCGAQTGSTRNGRALPGAWCVPRGPPRLRPASSAGSIDERWPPLHPTGTWSSVSPPWRRIWCGRSAARAYAALGSSVAALRPRNRAGGRILDAQGHADGHEPEQGGEEEDVVVVAHDLAEETAGIGRGRRADHVHQDDPAEQRPERTPAEQPGGQVGRRRQGGGPVEPAYMANNTMPRTSTMNGNAAIDSARNP